MECDAVAMQWSAVQWQCSEVQWSAVHCYVVSHNGMRSFTMEEWNAAIAVCEWSGLDYLVPISGRVVALNNEFVT